MGVGLSYVVVVVCTLLPALWGVHGYQLLGTLAPAIGFLFVAYAIIKYRAMEIEVVLSRTLVWVLTSALIFAANRAIASFIGGWIRGLNNWQLALIGTLLFYPLFFLTLKVQPTISRLLQREYHAMGEAVDGLMAEAGELTDVRTLSRFIIQRTCQVLQVPHVALLLFDEPLGRFVLMEEHEEETPLTPDDPFLAWLAENAVTLEREQVELRQRHQAIRPLARHLFPAGVRRGLPHAGPRGQADGHPKFRTAVGETPSPVQKRAGITGQVPCGHHPGPGKCPDARVGAVAEGGKGQGGILRPGAAGGAPDAGGPAAP